MYINTLIILGCWCRNNIHGYEMKYKVWGKAKTVLAPHKRHSVTLGLVLFIAALLLTLFMVVRLGMLYADTIYTGVREPYIQSLSSNSVIIRWQSEQATDVRVEIGKALDISDYIVEDNHSKEVHEISFKNLNPSTRYYYRIYHQQEIFRGGTEYWFETAPKVASDVPVRMWLIGDPGRSGENIQSVQNAMKEWIGDNPRPHQKGLKNPLNLIISTGDNAYWSGSNEDFQSGLFDVHKDLFKNTVFWPVYGNHDAKGWSFFKNFSLPKNAEAGGLASGTESYYSIDYASVHMIFLDSNNGGFSEDDEMMQWLKADLKQTQQKWVIAFMHHPSYTRGSHNSNDARDSGNRMFNMRKRVVPVLEKAGVDMVITGHSHSYERSYLVNCHYGVTSSFQAESILQKGPVFNKPKLRDAYQGVIYTVLGSSSKAVEGKFDHPVMAVSKAKLGSMILDINNDKLTARFIDNWADVLDQFEIIKSDKTLMMNKSQRTCQ